MGTLVSVGAGVWCTRVCECERVCECDGGLRVKNKNKVDVGVRG